MTWFFLTITAVFFIAIETVVEKKTLKKARSAEFAALFAFGNAIVLSPFLLIANLSQIDLRILGMIFLVSVPASASSFLVFKTLKHNALSEAGPILALLPLVASLFAFFVLGETMTPVQIAGLLLMVGGIVFLESGNLRQRNGIFRRGRGKYIVYAVSCLLLGATSVLGDRTVLHGFGIDPLVYLIFIQIFIAVNYAFFLLFASRPSGEFKGTVRDSWKIILFVSVLTVTHRYLYASAIQVASSIGMVVGVYKLSTLFHIFSGRTFFAEDGILKKAVSGTIILVGTVLLVAC
jgi:drug/metabolite transporter (DMT)-like permease